MSVLNKLKNNKKAVSPVVAAILLIGLVVVAGAAVAFIVLPMLNPPFTADNIDFGDTTPDVIGLNLRNVTIVLFIGNTHTTSTVTIDDVTVFVYNEGADLRTVDTEITAVTIDTLTISPGTVDIVTFVISWVDTDWLFDSTSDDAAVSMTITFISGGVTYPVVYTF